MITRRQVVLALASSALTAPFPAHAQQQAKVWRIGFLSARSLPTSINTDVYGAFTRGMLELGLSPGF